MIRLSNGHELEYVASSGALGYDGNGWAWEQPFKWVGLLDTSKFTPTTKTLTYLPRKGNFNPYNPLGTIRFIRGGVVNAIGLTNPGLFDWINKYGHGKQIVSIHPENESEAWVMASAISNRTNAIAIELNVSCPNVGCADNHQVISLCKSVCGETKRPVILKLSVTHDYKDIIPEVEGLRRLEAISINSVPWDVVFPGKKSPLAKYGGGAVSGKAAQKYTWEMVKGLTKITNIPVIGPSVWEKGDIEKLYELGAQAIGFGSIFLRKPWLTTWLI